MTSLIVLPDGVDRRTFLGGSDAAAIVGLAPEIGGKRKTALDVYFAKTRADGEPEQDALDAERQLFLRRRKRLEPYIAETLREELDVEIRHMNRRLASADCPWMAAEIDAEAETEDGLLNVEFKTVSPRAWGQKFGWGEPGTEDCPIHYWIQVQHGLLVTGRKRAALVAMVGLDDFLVYPIERAEDDIAKLRESLAKFWIENVLARVPPEPQTLPDLAKLFRPADKDKEVAVESEIASKALQLRAIRGQIDALGMQAEALEFDVKRAMGKAEFLLVEGQRLFSWKEQSYSRLDQQTLKESEPKIYKAYTLKGKHRVFKHYTTFGGRSEG